DGGDAAGIHGRRDRYDRGRELRRWPEPARDRLRRYQRLGRIRQRKLHHPVTNANRDPTTTTREARMSEPFIGEMRVVAFDFAPKGWLQCAGQTLQVSQYQP